MNRILSAIVCLSALTALNFDLHAQTIRYVRQNGTGDGNGSWANASGNLQDMINAASAGDAVWVAAGTYTAPGNYVMKEGVTILGGFPANGGLLTERNWHTNPTTLTTNSSSRSVISNNTLTDAAVLDGFTINSNLTLSYAAGQGGGIRNVGASPTIKNCRFKDNEASEAGGAIYNFGSSPKILNCVFEDNFINMRDFRIHKGGGAIFNDGSSPEIINCVFIRNITKAGSGGAIYNQYSAPKITNSVFYENRAGSSSDSQNPYGGSGWGGGIYNYTGASPVISNSTFYKNQAYIAGSTSNTGGALSNYFSGAIVVKNSIIYGNTSMNSIINGQNGNIFNYGSSLTISYSLVEGGYGGTANIGQAPQFADNNNIAGGDGLFGTTDDGLRLQNTSPAINAGNNTAATGGITTDITGAARVRGCTVDMGAYELQAGPGDSNFTVATPSSKSTCVGSAFPELKLTDSQNGQACFTIQEGITQTITAPAGALFSEVVFAGYGDPSGTCETGFTAGSCNAVNSVSIIENLALGNNSFTITATNETFGEPCIGVHKKLYLTLRYASPQYSWTHDNPAIGLPASGTGNIPSFEALAPGVATFTLSVASAACTTSGPVIFTYTAEASAPLHVDESRNVSGDGKSWETAFKTLQEALSAIPGQICPSGSILVAKGTYYPTGLQNGTDRNTTFLIPQRGGIKIFGGYPNGGGTRNTRENPTILSGDIGTPDDISDNSYHVLSMTNTLPDADSVVIDGLIITGGNANGPQYTYHSTLTNQNEGGGILLRLNSDAGTRIAIRNCEIKENHAVVAAGIYLWHSSPTITNCIISNNIAVTNGGGFFLFETPGLRLINSLLAENSAANGGGMYSTHAVSQPGIINSTFAGNTATANGNSLYAGGGSTVTVTNSILWSADAPKNIYNDAVLNISYSDVQLPDGIFAGTGNKNTDPGFSGASHGDYSLSARSPAINAGSNQLYQDAVALSGSSLRSPLAETGAGFDLAGNPRIYGDVIDMGAYEFDGTSLPVRWIYFEGQIGESGLTTLRWKAEETAAHHYELERSADARAFNYLADVPAAGRGTAAYHFTDRQPVSGTTYYRIRQVDADGTFSYSRIISVGQAPRPTLKAWPNPARESVTIELGPSGPGQLLRLVSATGVLLQEITVKGQAFTLPLEGYPAGAYLLYTADGTAVKILKE